MLATVITLATLTAVGALLGGAPNFLLDTVAKLSGYTLTAVGALLGDAPNFLLDTVTKLSGPTLFPRSALTVISQPKYGPCMHLTLRF